MRLILFVCFLLLLFSISFSNPLDVSFNLQNSQINPNTGYLEADLNMTNNSSSTIFPGNTKVIISNLPASLISGQDFYAQNEDGVTTQGYPYWNLDNNLGAGLNPLTSITLSKRIIYYSRDRSFLPNPLFLFSSNELCNGVDDDLDGLADFNREILFNWDFLTFGAPMGSAVTPNGNKAAIFLEKNTSGTCNSNTQFLVRTYDSNNSIVVTKQWGKIGNLGASLYEIIADGENIYVGGLKNTQLWNCDPSDPLQVRSPYPGGAYQAYLAKLDLQGNILWEKPPGFVLPEGNYEYFSGIKMKDNYVYASGTSWFAYNPHSASSAFFVKYDKDTGALVCKGYLQGQRDVIDYSSTASVNVDDLNNIYLFTARYNNFNFSNPIQTVAKFDSSCNYISKSVFPGYTGSVNSVLIDNNLIFAIYSPYAAAPNNTNTKIISLKTSFVSYQEKTINNFRSNSVVLAEDGNIYSFGHQKSLIRINPYNLNDLKIISSPPFYSNDRGDLVAGANYFNNSFFTTYFIISLEGSVTGGAAYLFNPSCISNNQYLTETCNGVDDDLDGLVDENACLCYKTDPPNGNRYPLSKTLGVNDPDLDAYWPLDGNLTDYSGSVLTNLTSNFTPIYDVGVNSTFLQAFDLNGGNYLNNTMGISPDNQKTVSFWFKPKYSRSSLDPEEYLFGLTTAKVNSCHWDDKSLKLKCNFWTGPAGLESTTTNWQAGRWYHLVITSSSNLRELWINGVKESVNDTSVPINPGLFSPLQIGSFAGDGNGFVGEVDDFAIFNRMLTECEIKQLALGPAACKLNCPSEFSCTGVIDGNASLCLDDNFGLTASASISLVDYCGISKCETVCNVGYHKQGDICVPIISGEYYCGGELGINSTPCVDANVGLVHDLNWSLISNNFDCGVIEKCRAYCNENFQLQGGVCVPNSGYVLCGGSSPVLVSGMIKGIGAYPSSMLPVPGSWDYNAEATASSYCQWKCDGGYFKSGNSCIQVITKNSITSFVGVFDENIILKSSCLWDANAVIGLEAVSGNYSKIFSVAHCLGAGNITAISDENIPLNVNMQVTLVIPQPCDVCSRTIYVNTVEQNQSTQIIPDNNFLIVLLFLCVIVAFISKKKISLS